MVPERWCIIEPRQIRKILDQVKSHQLDVEAAVEKLRLLPYEQMSFACVDHHRHLRRGFPEVIYCPGKTTEQIIEIFASLAATGANVLATRAQPEVFERLEQTGRFAGVEYDRLGRTISLKQCRLEGVGSILPIVTAGTADLPVAHEARATAEIMGQPAEIISDVGVAGLHRILGRVEQLQRANVVIVVAGMEGALASVVGGLVDCPVIAVPTSVGYGASFGGISALLTMLNSCASGVSVVNIDNGFSAAVSATMINRKIALASGKKSQE